MKLPAFCKSFIAALYTAGLRSIILWQYWKWKTFFTSNVQKINVSTKLQAKFQNFDDVWIVKMRTRIRANTRPGEVEHRYDAA